MNDVNEASDQNRVEGDDMERALRALGQAAPAPEALVAPVPSAAPAAPEARGYDDRQLAMVREASSVATEQTPSAGPPGVSGGGASPLSDLVDDDPMTEADVLLALIVQALDGEPVDVLGMVTALGYGDMVEAARVILEAEAFERGALGEVDDPALEDPDADELDETAPEAGSDQEIE